LKFGRSWNHSGKGLSCKDSGHERYTRLVRYGSLPEGQNQLRQKHILTVIGQHRVNAKPDDFVVIRLFLCGAFDLSGLMLAAGLLFKL
jgi:hypothetical protein